MSERKAQKQLSARAQQVLGYILTIAERNGEFAATHGEIAKALKVSPMTVRRALQELRKKGELVVVEEGGGRGRPTRYRVKRISPEPVTISSTPRHKEAYVPTLSTKARRKPVQAEHVHELVQPFTLREVRAWGHEFGETVMAFLIGAAQGAIGRWRTASYSSRVLIITSGASLLGTIAGWNLGGRRGALIGGISGILLSLLLVRIFEPVTSKVPNAWTEQIYNG
jgi:transposase